MTGTERHLIYLRRRKEWIIYAFNANAPSNPVLFCEIYVGIVQDDMSKFTQPLTFPNVRNNLCADHSLHER